MPEGTRIDPAETTIARTLTLEQRIGRMEAVHEVQNVMGRYVNWHAANMHDEALGLFALKTPGVRAEMMWGVYEGPESLERLYPGYHVWVDGDTRGRMHLHPLTTPVIEVADDLRTAKATWICPGLETMSFAAGADGENAEAFWAWSKFSCDFIVEDGEWKIWHLHVHGLFLTPFDRPWTDDPSDHDGMEFLPQFEPDSPPTTHWMYSKERVYPNEPRMPERSATFDESSTY